MEKLMAEDRFDPFQLVEIDPVLISPRHLYRMPYSLHRKTFLVSLPVPLTELARFTREQAQPDQIQFHGYLDQAISGEAESLVAEALDFASKHQKPKPTLPAQRAGERFSQPVPVDDFPPCMKTILGGMADGKKRASFVLVNFLASCKWKPEDIENAMMGWNAKNQPPLSETFLRNYIRTKLTQMQGEPKPPPNCTQEGYYVSMGVCAPDSTCKSRESLRNPLVYPLRKLGPPEEPKEKKQKPKPKYGKRARQMEYGYGGSEDTRQNQRETDFPSTAG